MFKFLNFDILGGLARHVMTTAGGVLVGNGLLTGNELQDGIGALFTLAGVLWSVIKNIRGATERKIAVAATVAAVQGMPSGAVTRAVEATVTASDVPPAVRRTLSGKP